MADGEPLPSSFSLTPFEQYLLAEDRPDFPCWIVVKFYFRGSFQRAETQLALEKAVERNPLLGAVLRRGAGGRLRWEVLPDWKPQVCWLKGPLKGEWPEWENLNLFEKPGFRFFVIEQEEERTEWVFHIHHAICDGKALRDVFYDIVNHYATVMGKPVALPELRPEIFAQRNRLATKWLDWFKSLPSQAIGLWLTYRFEKKRIAPLALAAAAPTGGGRPESYPAVVSRRLPEERFRKVRDEALSQKVSVNDIFLRDLFHSLKLWREWKGEGDGMDWLRVVLPVDMRKPVDRFLSAANLTSIVTLDRRMKSAGNRERLLKRTHEDMDWVKNRGLRYTFWTLLRLRRLFPNGIERYSHRPSCQGTIIFANHCQFFTRSPLLNKERKMEVPGALLEDMTLVSPIRPGTTAALVVGTYAGRVLVDLHYDPRFLTQPQVDKLLEIFLAQLELYEGKASRTPPGA